MQPSAKYVEYDLGIYSISNEKEVGSQNNSEAPPNSH